TAAPRLVTARSPASEAVEAAPSGGFQPADRHPDGSPGSLPVRAGIAPNVGRHVGAARARTEASAGTVEAAQPGRPSLSGAIPGPAPRRPSDGSVSPAATVRRSTQPAPVSTWTSAAPTALLTAHTVASWSHPRGAPGPGVPSGSGGNSPPGAPPAPVWRRPGPRPADSAGTVVHQPT